MEQIVVTTAQDFEAVRDLAVGDHVRHLQHQTTRVDSLTVHTAEQNVVAAVQAEPGVTKVVVE